MGVIYKLKPEIIEFILKTTTAQPQLGCRKISYLIQEQFKVSVSKSSINSVIKTRGFSKPAGRRPIHKKRAQKIEPPQSSDTPQLLITREQKSALPLVIVEGSKAGLEPPKKEPAEEAEPKVTLLMPSLQELPEGHLVKKMGCWFLKAADLCLGGVAAVSDALASVILDKDANEIIAGNETLLYMPCFSGASPQDLNMSIGYLAGRPYSASEIDGLINFLRPMGSLNSLLLNRLKSRLVFVSRIKFTLADSSFYFLDGNMHSIWSNTRIPKTFSNPIPKVKGYLDASVLVNNQPLVLQAPAGFGVPTEAFFNFVYSWQGRSDKAVKSIELYSQEDKMIEMPLQIPLRQNFFILGLWPWQFTQARNTDSLSGSGPFSLKLTNEDFSLTEARMLLRHPQTKAELGLRSVILKKDKQEILSIITNIEKDVLTPQEVARLYLERWPNLESGYQDFLAKIESARQSNKEKELFLISAPDLAMPEDALDLRRILDLWRERLGEYCQIYFFPPEYKNSDISSLKERFYELEGQIAKQIGHCKIKFIVQSDFEYLDDLVYACQKANERDVRLYDGSRLLFEVHTCPP